MISTEIHSGTKWCYSFSGTASFRPHPLSACVIAASFARMQSTLIRACKRKATVEPGGQSARLSIRDSVSPYNGFKSDKERRRALISRDIRLVLIALVLACSGPGVGARFERWWTQVASK